MQITGWISEDPEQYVLGSCLRLGVEAFDRSQEKIKNVNCFDNPRHRLIWKNLIKVYKMKEGVSLDITLFLANFDKETIAKMGGGSFLFDLTVPVTTIARLDAHLDIVTEKYLKRQIIERVNVWAERTQGGTYDSTAILNLIDTDTENIRGGISNNDYSPLSDLYPEVRKQTDERETGQNKDNVIYTGFSELDYLTGGFRRGHVIIIAGETGHGKTELALQISENVAVREDKKVLIVSIEMDGTELAERTLYGQAGVGYDKRDGYKSLTGEDWSKLESVKNDNILYNDNPNIIISEVKSLFRQAKKRDDISLGVVDYLQLMGTDTNYENRQQEISYLSRTIAKLAKELGIPILVLSQLSRQNQNRRNKEPEVSDLRESGAIGHDADKIIMVYLYPQEKGVAHREGSWFVRKNRKGRTGSVPVLLKEGRWLPRQIHEVSEERAA